MRLLLSIPYFPQNFAQLNTNHIGVAGTRETYAIGQVLQASIFPFLAALRISRQPSNGRRVLVALWKLLDPGQHHAILSAVVCIVAVDDGHHQS